MSRDYTATDHLLMRLHQGVTALIPHAPPRQALLDATLDAAERQHAAGLMRINHAGEVAAQALYHGQALTARKPELREHLLKAANEEQQHLQWCEERLAELGSEPSHLQPLWAAGSFAIGAAAGLAGDAWSLGFVAETEKQVSEHLQNHLQQLPEHDQRSRGIVSAMSADEQRHGAEATAAGGRELPSAVRAAMKAVARVMKYSAYRI